MSNASPSTPNVILSSGPNPNVSMHVVNTISDLIQQGQISTGNEDILEAQSELAVACMAIVKERHKCNITLAQETLQLVQLLPDDDSSNVAYRSYLYQLTEIDHEQSLAASQGKNINEVTSQSHVQLIQSQALTDAHDVTIINSFTPTAIK